MTTGNKDELKPSVGRIVHYVDDDGSCRAAVVTRVSVTENKAQESIDYLVDLEVFGKTPLAEMVRQGGDGKYPESVKQDESVHKHKRTWHWPEVTHG